MIKENELKNEESMFMIFMKDTFGESPTHYLLTKNKKVKVKVFNKGTIILRTKKGNYNNTVFVLHDGMIFEACSKWLEEIVLSCEDSSKE